MPIPTTADLYPRTVIVWSDRRLHWLEEAYVYEWSKDLVRYRLTVPAGTLTDLASVPQFLWWWIAPRDLREASILHDDGYTHGGDFGDRWQRWDGRQWVVVESVWTRRELDRLFGRVMRERGVPMLKRRAAFLAVRLFGWRAWKERA